VYADDILLIIESVSLLQCLSDVVQAGLLLGNMSLNISKCCAMRMCSRFDVTCANANRVLGDLIAWVNEIRNLGVFLVAGRVIKFSGSSAKANSKRTVNSELSKILSAATEDLSLQAPYQGIIRMPTLLYCLEVCDLNKDTLASLDFSVMRVGFRILRTGSRAVLRDYFNFFNWFIPSEFLQHAIVGL
jgi:hypothetical protein